MQIMKFKFKRIFVIPASWYHSAQRVLIPFVTSEGFVDEMVKALAPRPQMPARQRKIKELSSQYGASNSAQYGAPNPDVDRYYAQLKASQETALKAWHKDVKHTSEYSIRDNGDSHYAITVNTTLAGPTARIAPFKKCWPTADAVLMN